MDPDVLILDEPTAGLDPMGRDTILGQLMAYHKTRGNTVLLVSHNMEEIARFSDRVLVMKKGKAAFFDNTAQVFQHGTELMRMGFTIAADSTDPGPAAGAGMAGGSGRADAGTRGGRTICPVEQ